MSYLIFFPSVTFSLLAAEIFPWAFLYAIVKMRSVSYKLLGIVAFALISFTWVGLAYNGQYFVESVRSVAAYFNPLFIFFVILKVPEKEITKLYKVLCRVLVFLFILGLLQFLSVLTPMEGILQFLIPRASGDVLSGTRGVTLLASEPSRASVELIFIYAAWRTITVVSGYKLVLADIFLSIFVVVIIRSAVGAGVLVILMAFCYGWRAIVPTFLLAVVFSQYFSSVRAVDVFSTLLSQGSLEESYTYLLNQSGFRLVSVLSSYFDAATNLFGNGVGTWEESSVNAIAAMGYDGTDLSYFRYRSEGELYGVRPTSFFAGVALELGLVGLVAFSYAVLSEIFKLLHFAGSRVFPLLCIFLFTSYFVGAIGNPVPWICLALVLRMLVMRETDGNPRESDMSKRKIGRLVYG